MKIPSTIAAIAPDGRLTPAQRRRFIIEMSLRRVKPGTGSGPEFLKRRTAMNPWPDLRPILKDFPWAIAGVVATRAYMPERATKNVDILVHRQNSEEILKRLQLAGYQLISELIVVPGFLLQSPDGVEVDVILGDYPWLDEALARPRRDPAGYPALDLPYLILMKLEASRAQDLGDLSRMLGLASEKDLERVRAAVIQYAPDMAEDLESLIYLGQLEMRPPAAEEWPFETDSILSSQPQDFNINFGGQTTCLIHFKLLTH